jgi:hypothetical protein
VYIDLVGFDVIQAREKLLAGLEPGRAKPLTEPTYPGTPVDGQQDSPVPPVTRRPLAWRPLSDHLRSFGGATCSETRDMAQLSLRCSWYRQRPCDLRREPLPRCPNNLFHGPCEGVILNG